MLVRIIVDTESAASRSRHAASTTLLAALQREGVNLRPPVPDSGEAERKGAPLAVGELIVDILQSTSSIATIALVVDSFLHRRGARIRFKDGDDELEVDHASAGDRRRLIESWLTSRSTSPPARADSDQ